MKKASILGVLFVALSFTFEAKAQENYVYDGGSFDIKLTCTNRGIVRSISYNSNNQWVNFSIENSKRTSNGFLYEVKNETGESYTVLYDKNQDFITVTKPVSGTSWRQNRK